MCAITADRHALRPTVEAAARRRVRLEPHYDGYKRHDDSNPDAQQASKNRTERDNAPPAGPVLRKLRHTSLGLDEAFHRHR